MFNIGSKDALEKMGALLKEGSWRVLSLEKIAQFRRITLGLIGHIIRTKSVESLVNKVDALGANVSKFSVNMPNQSGESSALISFEAEDDEVIEKAMAEIENTCRQNDLLLIRAVD